MLNYERIEIPTSDKLDAVLRVPGAKPEILQRKLLSFEDIVLGLEGKALLAEIAEQVRLVETARLYPRIINRIAKLWRRSLKMDAYFENLLVDERGNRNGFPFLVVAELGALKDHYITVAFPKGSDVWNDAYAK